MTPYDQDTVLLAFISLFGFLCAALIAREGRLGWALFLKNVTYSLAFGYTALGRVWPHLDYGENARSVLRWMIASAIVWAIVELVWARYLLWQQHGMDPRVVMERREAVVGRREGVMTKREDVVTKREDVATRREDAMDQ